MVLLLIPQKRLLIERDGDPDDPCTTEGWPIRAGIRGSVISVGIISTRTKVRIAHRASKPIPAIAAESRDTTQSGTIGAASGCPTRTGARDRREGNRASEKTHRNRDLVLAELNRMPIVFACDRIDISLAQEP